MPNPTWPVSLPQFVDQRDYSETFPNVAIHTQMDSGAPKSRRRFTAGVQLFPSVTLQIDANQRATLRTFWETTLLGGVLEFDWVHPVTQVVATFKMPNSPTIRALSGDTYLATINGMLLLP